MTWAPSSLPREGESKPVAVPGGHSGHCPSKDYSPGANMSFAPQTEAGPPGPASAPSWGFLSGLRAPRDGSGPRGKHQDSIRASGRIRAPRSESGPEEQTRAPMDEPGRIKYDESGCRGMNQGPQDVPVPLKTNQGPMQRTRALQDEAGAPTPHIFFKWIWSPSRK